MVNYRDLIDRAVYYTKIKYDEKLRDTKINFIKGLYNDEPNDEFKKSTNRLWKEIDHKYMEQTINDLEEKIRADDRVTLQEQRGLPNQYKLNEVKEFTKIEDKYANHIERIYDNATSNEVEYLTTRIDEFDKVERTIPYKRNGEIVSMHTPAEYLSMLYNVNLRMASWNTTIKDAQVLGDDLLFLVSHPHACDVCNEHMNKIYSISGKKYDIPNFEGSLDKAYKEGVGHPNCKCNFIIYNEITSQFAFQEQYDVRDDLYKPIQKARALDREIKKLDTNVELYEYIGNYQKADDTITKRNRLDLDLQSLLDKYDIEKYLQ